MSIIFTIQMSHCTQEGSGVDPVECRVNNHVDDYVNDPVEHYVHNPVEDSVNDHVGDEAKGQHVEILVKVSSLSFVLGCRIVS